MACRSKGNEISYPTSSFCVTIGALCMEEMANNGNGESHLHGNLWFQITCAAEQLSGMHKSQRYGIMLDWITFCVEADGWYKLFSGYNCHVSIPRSYEKLPGPKHVVCGRPILTLLVMYMYFLDRSFGAACPGSCAVNQ